MREHSRLSPAPRTFHAMRRMQQRSIPQAIVDLLIDFGDMSDAGGGAERFSFSKRSWRQAASYLGTQAKHFERYRHAYVVMGPEGEVITVAYQH